MTYNLIIFPMSKNGEMFYDRLMHLKPAAVK